MEGRFYRYKTFQWLQAEAVVVRQVWIEEFGGCCPDHIEVSSLQCQEDWHRVASMRSAKVCSFPVHRMGQSYFNFQKATKALGRYKGRTASEQE
jgi:hypothetical protein